MSDNKVLPTPRLVKPLLIMINPEMIFEVAVNIYSERLLLTKKSIGGRYYDTLQHNVKRNAHLVVQGNSAYDFDRITTVDAYVEQLQKLREAAGMPRLKDPRMFVSNTRREDPPIVVDMAGNYKGWGGRKHGWKWDIEDGTIGVDERALENPKDKPYPYKYLYLGYNAMGIPYAFIYPTLKNFVSSVLADPYAYKDQKTLTLKVKDLHRAEELFDINVSRCTVTPKNSAALNKAAAEEVKKL